MTSLSESSKNFSNVRRSRDQIFKKLLLNEDPAQPKINFFLNCKKKKQKQKPVAESERVVYALICDPYI